jgi:hypothetical protein
MTLLPKTAVPDRGKELSRQFRPHSEESRVRIARTDQQLSSSEYFLRGSSTCGRNRTVQGEKVMNWISRYRFIAPIWLVASLLASAAPASAAVTDEMEMTPSAKDMPTVVPSKQETAESVFAKLDAGKKGFISMADVTVLPGFDKVFQAADGDHDGKLSLKEFKGAWATYSGTTDPIVDAPGVE